jgi:hypothetical protein
MRALLTLQDALWILTTSVEIALLVYLVRRKLPATHLAFTFYIAIAIAQSALAAFVYWRWGMQSGIASEVIWASQGIVICFRFWTVLETTARILSGYQGIWALAKRLLWVTGICTVSYALFVSKKQINSLVLSLDRGVELAIAAFLVAMLLFARYYLLPVRPLDRALALGLGLYSCFYVINDSLFEQYLNSYLQLWGYLDVLTFLASLLIWLYAVHAYSNFAIAAPEAKQIPERIYENLSPEINYRLKNLNDQISRLFQTGKPRQ